MIQIYTGNPGSGKSFHTAKRIYTATKNKYHVFSNFILNKNFLKRPEYYHYIPNDKLNAVDILTMIKPYIPKKYKEGSILLVLDEAQLFLNCRDFRDKNRPAWAKFCQLHRKYSIDIVFISQSIDYIDKQIRNLADFKVVHFRLGSLPIFRQLEKILPFKFFVSNAFIIGFKKKAYSDWFISSKKIFRLYDTTQIFDKSSDFSL